MNRQIVFCPPVPHPTLFVCIISWTCISNFVLEVDITLAMEKQAILSICLRIGSHLILFVFFVQIYLMEELRDYIANRITTTSQFQEVSVSEFPTITITWLLGTLQSACKSKSCFCLPKMPPWTWSLSNLVITHRDADTKILPKV